MVTFAKVVETFVATLPRTVRFQNTVPRWSGNNIHLMYGPEVKQLVLFSRES